MVLTSSSSTASTTSMFSMSTPSSAAAQTRVASLSLLSISTVLVLSTPRVLGTGPALTGLARRRGAPLIAPPATLPLNPLMVFTSSSFSGDESWHSCLSHSSPSAALDLALCQKARPQFSKHLAEEHRFSTRHPSLIRSPSLGRPHQTFPKGNLFAKLVETAELTAASFTRGARAPKPTPRAPPVDAGSRPSSVGGVRRTDRAIDQEDPGGGRAATKG